MTRDGVGCIDLSQIKALQGGYGQRWLPTLKPGDPVGLCVLGVEDCIVVANGFIDDISGGQVVAAFKRLTGPRLPGRLVGLPGKPFGVNSGKKVRKGMPELRRGANVHIIERYASGYQAQISGRVTTVVGDAFRVGGHWFDFGARQDSATRDMQILA